MRRGPILAVVVGVALPFGIANLSQMLGREPPSATGGFSTHAQGRFEQAWSAVPAGGSVLLKSDPPVRSIDIVKTVATERIIPLPPPAPPIEILRTPVVEKKRGDICSRHNMHKVLTRGGKSWRCRR